MFPQGTYLNYPTGVQKTSNAFGTFPNAFEVCSKYFSYTAHTEAMENAKAGVEALKEVINAKGKAMLVTKSSATVTKAAGKSAKASKAFYKAAQAPMIPLASLPKAEQCKSLSLDVALLSLVG